MKHPKFAQWTNKDLLRELSLYFDIIYGEYPDYDLRDMEFFEQLEEELESRGVEWAKESGIRFHEVE